MRECAVMAPLPENQCNVNSESTKHTAQLHIPAHSPPMQPRTPMSPLSQTQRALNRDFIPHTAQPPIRFQPLNPKP